jgi:hypothetical protein
LTKYTRKNISLLIILLEVWSVTVTKYAFNSPKYVFFVPPSPKGYVTFVPRTLSIVEKEISIVDPSVPVKLNVTYLNNP